MNVSIMLGALLLLILAAYRGYSVILFAPIAAMGAVLLTKPSAVAPAFNGIFLEQMVAFVKSYFPVFLLGAIFGKLIELSGFSRSIVAAVIRVIGARQSMAAVVIVSAVLTYGGVSLFVVVFAVYPFAAELFRQGDIPKRLIPAAVALGAFTFTMTALPGTPQIQNIIPGGFFKTNSLAAPRLGVVGGAFIFVAGLAYLRWRQRRALAAGEGYGRSGETDAPSPTERLPHPAIAVLPLVLVGVMNLVFTRLIRQGYGERYTLELPGLKSAIGMDVQPLVAIWAVEAALLVGIVTVLAFAFRTVASRAAEGSRAAVGGALLASLNTASEYGFGAVLAALPGFVTAKTALGHFSNPLVNEAVTVNALAGMVGSASGGMSIALAAMAGQFIKDAEAAGIPMEVLHRVAAMSSGGMDLLPHNGAVITLLTVTGLTHRQSYRDIFAITLISTAGVFVVIAVYQLTGIV